jgi:glycosyltransferase involved in cell wall biosynthesis
MMVKQKIITIAHYSSLYGANRSLLALIEGTRDRLDWVVFCRGTPDNSGDLRSELLKLDVKCFTIPYRMDVYAKNESRLESKYFFFVEGIYNFFWALGISIYARIQDVKLIHTNSSATCLGAYVAFLSSRPHIWHFREFLTRDYGLSYKFGMRFLAYWANRAKAIVSISASIDKACVKDRGIHVPSFIIFNGVISEGGLPILAKKAIGTSIKLAIVGVLGSAKDQLEAIKAVQLLAIKGYNVILDVLGEAHGDYYQDLLLYVQSNGLADRVRFRGYVTNVKDIFSQADITIMCSKNEGMGRVTIESMAYGIPVVGFNEAGTAELIEDGTTGMLYDGNEVELAAAVEKLIVSDGLYQSIRENAYGTVKTKYTTEIYASNFVNALKS